MEIIFHIDVNSAFLSWSAIERLRRDPETPDLRTIPSIIGGDEKSRHGVVLAKSIPAKKYGVRTGEPVATALRKCPFLVMEPPDHKLYRRRSAQLMKLLHTYTSDIEQVSIDECYLLFSPIAWRFPSPETAAREIADRVRGELDFTVNVGISTNKLLAKMASDFEKPDRVHTLFPDEIPSKMWPLPVGELFMVGHSSASRLEELGIRTIGDLAMADPAFLQAHFKSHGQMMWEYANGIDDSPLDPDDHDAKGIGNSTTLATDARTAEDAKRILLQLAEEVAARLRKSHQLAQTVVVELRYSNFHTCSRQTGLPAPDATTDALYRCACRLFDELWNQSPIRLLGLRTTRLVSEDAPVQLNLFDAGLVADTAVPAHDEHSFDSHSRSSFAANNEHSLVTHGKHSFGSHNGNGSDAHAEHSPGTHGGYSSGSHNGNGSDSHGRHGSSTHGGHDSDTHGGHNFDSHGSDMRDGHNLAPSAPAVFRRSHQTDIGTQSCQSDSGINTIFRQSDGTHVAASRQPGTGGPVPNRRSVQDNAARQRRLEQTLDEIRARYGKGAVIRGSLLEKSDSPVDE